MAHLFEQRHDENREFATGDRLVFHDIDKVHKSFVRNQSLLAVLEALRQPALVFEEHRQLVYANRSALKHTDAETVQEVLALRLGEFLGTEHKMEGHQCGQIGGCADCNRLPSLIAALKGQQSEQVGELILFPENAENRARFTIRSSPLPIEGKTWALVLLEPTTQA